MIRTNNKIDCCGCKTCSIVCPNSCITFFEDPIGAVYPQIDIEKCVNCGSCESVCPIQQTFDNQIGKTAYAAFSSDKNTRFRGSSGGIFESIAASFIEKQGSVFASKFDKNLKLRGFEAVSIEEVRELTKSKYLQSDNSNLFPIIKERINAGKQTLFCGTPCQVAALNKYLGKDSDKENFFCLDFFCHGVPSQSFFDKCKKYVEEKNRIRILTYEFRTKKKNGVTPHYYTISYEKKGNKEQKTDLYLKDPFYLGFQKYITLRDSCYHCPYGKGNHCGDITIGDFHEIEKYVHGVNRFDGVSTVIINTEKGKDLWNQINDSLTTYEINIQTLYEDGQIYSGGTKEPNLRTEFLSDMESMPFEKVIDKWLNSKDEWKKELYYSLPTTARKAIKSIAGIK